METLVKTFSEALICQKRKKKDRVWGIPKHLFLSFAISIEFYEKQCDNKFVSTFNNVLMPLFNLCKEIMTSPGQLCIINDYLFIFVKNNLYFPLDFLPELELKAIHLLIDGDFLKVEKNALFFIETEKIEYSLSNEARKTFLKVGVTFLFAEFFVFFEKSRLSILSNGGNNVFLYQYACLVLDDLEDFVLSIETSFDLDLGKETQLSYKFKKRIIQHWERK
jgi:hypothetical protein